MTDDALDKVIHGIYEAALMPSLWTSVLIEARRLFSAQLVTIVPTTRPAELMATPGFEEVQRSYGDYWWQHDRLTLSASRGETTGKIIRDWEVLSADALRRDPYYQDFRRPHGLGHLFGYVFEPSIGELFGLGVQLPVDDARVPGETADRRLTTIARHIERVTAMSVRLSLDCAVNDLGTALSALPNSVALLDRQGGVMFANAAFADFAASGLRIERRLLRTPRLADQPKLDAMIRNALSPGMKGPDVAAVSQRGGRHPLLIRVIPLPATERVAALDPFRPRAGAMVLVVDPRVEREGNVDLALRSLGLTPAEARVAACIGTGRNGPETAELLGTSHHTIRSQIKASMLKLGVVGQGELVAMVARLSALLAKKEEGP
ncbi:helix-turn-helix transcriptional regulator [Lichenihabitans sp. Uapishka_5]|uniref:helix-turn-helix transcriptional regulator n=1 Tax=Lichenihabitans sp. Uapishka_5 TaxID=3037302 RepID=UPI0029E7F309|nr:helix-turn-helix transcriptional regulator [Lichenihabitans sp. Uapishka_5]MDX7952809.1 helix-turn-helix transcriptional regulator [Lichenihabitans sp. Uapishka_5]